MGDALDTLAGIIKIVGLPVRATVRHVLWSNRVVQ